MLLEITQKIIEACTEPGTLLACLRPVIGQAYYPSLTPAIWTLSTHLSKLAMDCSCKQTHEHGLVSSADWKQNNHNAVSLAIYFQLLILKTKQETKDKQGIKEKQ